jgi:CDP-glucose 4,6-dehydratase
MEGLVIDSDFWKDRRVLITGHTGFKGGWLSLWLNQLGARVYGYAIDPPNNPAFFKESKVESSLEQSLFGDIQDSELLLKVMTDINPEIVIHMAAQSLVKESYMNPKLTYSTNILGTVNVFEAVRSTTSVKVVLNITSDKCYENKETNIGYTESDSMGGYDPYSSSKGCSELISSAYRQSFFHGTGVALATARAGNVIGGGDWAKNRIIPDAIRAFLNNKPLLIRNPVATRPWQHVLEPLSGYIILCQHLMQSPEFFADGWNFGPTNEGIASVSVLADKIINRWGNSAMWKLDEEFHPHEASLLSLDCSKANNELNWRPIWNLDRTILETINWYKAWEGKEDMHNFSLNQIRFYQQEFLTND